MRWLAEDITRWLRQWDARIETGYAATGAELAAQKELCLEEGSEELRAAFATVTRLERKMATLRVETAALRMMERLHVAALRAAMMMVRAETALSRMLLWPRWPG